MTKTIKSKKQFFLLILITFVFLLAAFFRLWKLNLIPPGLYPDVAINGNDALDTLESHHWKLFYPENNGREGLFMWLIALSFVIFKPSVWAIKIVAAIIGILTVIGFYLLTEELFRVRNQKLIENYKLKIESSTAIALLSSFFLATSFWHVNFSRIGFRAIMVPFCLVFAFYFLFKGFSQKRTLFFIISGIFFGLGFYTYISYRFIILLLPIGLLYWFLKYKKENNYKLFFNFSAFCLITTFLVALPIGVYFLLHPADFFGRASEVSIFSSERPLYELTKAIVLHLAMFNFYGDTNWRHNFSGQPELFWPVGIFFLIGLILSFKNKDYFLLSWFFIMLFPGFLSREGNPHALRVIGSVPPVFIFSGLGSYWFLKEVNNFLKKNWQKTLFSFCFLLLLIYVAFGEFNRYFYQWAKRAETESAFSKDYYELGNYLNSLPDNVSKYVIVNQNGVPVPFPNGIPMPAQTPMFIERAKFGKIRATYLLPEDLKKIKIEEDAIVIPLHKP